MAGHVQKLILNFQACLYVVPGVIIFMYLTVWGGHLAKAMEQQQDVRNIPRMYMSSEDTGFWVAEAYEPLFSTSGSTSGKLTVVTEASLKTNGLDLNHCRRTLVGTVAVLRSKQQPDDVAWIRRLSVRSKYR